MQKLHPKLRFPQFEKDWELKKLGDFTNWSSGGTPSKQNSGFWNGKIPWISATSMRGSVYSDSELKITELGLRKGSRLAKKGTLLILVRGSMLFNKIPIGITGVDVAFNQDLKSIEVQKDSFSCFILYWFSQQEHVLLDLVTATGIGAGKLDLRELKNLTINLPTLPEQTKIASFLTTVDEKISGFKKQLTLLERYKKGVMQKIFSQELRFKDENGNDFPDWEEKKLGEICNITTGKLDANAMIINGRYRFYTCAKDYYLIDKYAFDTEALLISGNGANVGYIHYYKGKFNAYQRTYVLYGFTEFILFIKYFLSQFLKQRIGLEKKDGNTPYIVLSVLTEMKIKIPSLPEQQKIASFLSSIDEKIEKCQGQIKAMERWKKGLLQQMFV